MNLSDSDNVHKDEPVLLTSGLASDVFPKPSLKESLGVSTRSIPIQASDIPHWYALRATYGREKKAYEYILSKGGTAFYPTIIEEKIIRGKRKTLEASRLPNIFFAYGTEKEIQAFVYDNVNLPFLRFYYKYSVTKQIKEPLIVPDRQMKSLRIICEAEANDVIILPDTVQKFSEGEFVRITEGVFAGVEGRVARFYGQQRVGVVIDGLLTVATAYVPSAFLEYK